MRTRVDEMVSEARERALLTTFHSFSADILRQHGSHIGIEPDFVILNQDADREGALLDAIKRLQKRGIEASEADVRLLPMIDKLLEKCVAEEEVESSIRDQRLGPRVARVYGEYRRQLRESRTIQVIYCRSTTRRPRRQFSAKPTRTISSCGVSMRKSRSVAGWNRSAGATK